MHDLPALLSGDGVQFGRGIHDRSFLTKSQHGEIGGAIRIAVGAVELVITEHGGIELAAQTGDFVPAFVIDQIWK